MKEEGRGEGGGEEGGGGGDVGVRDSSSPGRASASPSLEDDHSGERRRCVLFSSLAVNLITVCMCVCLCVHRVLEERLRETEQRSRQLKSWSGVQMVSHTFSYMYM